jgi:hypothetical protein
LQRLQSLRNAEDGRPFACFQDLLSASHTLLQAARAGQWAIVGEVAGGLTAPAPVAEPAEAEDYDDDGPDLSFVCDPSDDDSDRGSDEYEPDEPSSDDDIPDGEDADADADAYDG